MDTITDSSGFDKIKFGEGITSANLSFFKQGNNLLIFINDNHQEGIIINRYFEGSYNIELLEFTDGSSINLSQSLDIKLGDTGESIDGTIYNDTITGGDGNDTINGGNGDDTLSDGIGEDTMSGGDGADIISGGTGDDTIDGGAGNDTYIWNLGDGMDTITDSQGTEKIVFGEGIRELLSFLPSNNMEDAPLVPCNDDIHRQVEALQTVIPEDPNMPYDIKDIIEPVLDNQYFFEVMPHFAKNVVVGFGRLGGRSVGIVANQPAWLAGVLDIDASDKAARFIRFCDCFNIPLITFEDVPGFLPGTVQEHNGIIRHGAKIVYAYAEATVPKVTLITRKAYGGAYIVMSSKPTGADVNLAYPQAEIAVMGAEGAVNILYRKSAPEEKAEIIKEYEDKFSNPYRAAERGLIDEVIMPRDTRYKLIQALEMCHNKNQSNPPKKHGNMPL